MTIKNLSVGMSALLLTGALAVPSFAQQTTTQATDQSTTVNQTSATQASATMSANPGASDSTYATGQPLAPASKEGFWGHVNPLARKKWVKRQIDPVRDRVNELDQLQAKNASDIRDVDTRATAGIKKANDAAALADRHAGEAASRADAANSTATAAATRTEALHGTVQNLDQYQTVSSVPVGFAAGRTTLGPHAKADLSQIADTLSTEKGYIIEVEGYSRSGVASSQAMADSVVRYLVTEKQVPIYRIYRSGMGKASAKTTPEGEKLVANGVRVTLLHNSLATMDGASAVSRNTQPATDAVPATTGASLQ